MNVRRTLTAFSFFVVFAVSLEAQEDILHPKPAPVTPAPPLTPEEIAKSPVNELPINKFQLLAPTTGWASTGNRLLWTTDSGAHWKDISPPNRHGLRYADVFFLDPDTGWVLFPNAPQGDAQTAQNDTNTQAGHWERDWAFYVAATTDGGRTWTESHVQMPKSNDNTPILNDNGNLTFVDKLHGWLELEHQTGSAFSYGSLMVTDDGGKTWRMSDSDPGFYGNIRVTPNGEFWALGGTDDDLVVRHQGEKDFHDFSLPSPKEISPGMAPVYSLPVFEDDHHGYEAVTYVGPRGVKSSAALFETVDGGRTWSSDRMLSNLPEEVAISSTIADSTWVVPFTSRDSQPRLIKIHRNDRVIAPSLQSKSEFGNCSASFAGPNDGWISCSGKLFSTSDGGGSWKPRLLPEPATEYSRKMPLARCRPNLP
jgi:photosystem II stability/assembly factor-like uncharacterized protein